MKRIAIILAIAVVAIFAARQAMADNFIVIPDTWAIVDFDGDGDGIPNSVDNCPGLVNPDQLDTDGDLHGNLCDYCPNDPLHWPDNAPDSVGVCISPDDQDGDGILDDGDGSGTAGDNPCIGGNTVNCDDNCPEFSNSFQIDWDSDGFGNGCDACAEFGSTPDNVDDTGCIIDDGDADADSADADDYDGDGVSDDDDECYDIEGVASCYGCPASYCEVYDFSDNISMLGDADSESSQASAGGCSLTPAGSANKVSLLILALGLLPLAIRRRIR